MSLVATQCEECAGSGTVTCWTCEGSGYEKCDECGGRKWIGPTCPHCEEPIEECDYCDSDGDVRCSTCGGDCEGECGDCEGRGYVEHEEEDEDDSGVEPEPEGFSVSALKPIAPPVVEAPVEIERKPCPHGIQMISSMAKSHYRPDGTCRCDDSGHVEMIKWGFTWDEILERWMKKP